MDFGALYVNGARTLDASTPIFHFTTLEMAAGSTLSISNLMAELCDFGRSAEPGAASPSGGPQAAFFVPNGSYSFRFDSYEMSRAIRTLLA